MSTGISPDNLDIFLQLTLQNFDRGRSWVNLTQKYHNLTFVNRFMSDKKVPEEGGKNLAWKVQVTRVDNTRDTQLYDQDTSNIGNGMKEASISWNMKTTNYTYDVNEPAFQGGSMTEIIDIMELKESEMYEGWAEHMEETMWTCPAVDADPAPAYGVPYWLVKNSSSTPGFNGGAPTGYTTVANLNPSTYTRHKNWTFTYTLNTWTRTDFVRKTVEAMHMCNFNPIPKVGGIPDSKPNWTLQTTWAAYEACQELAEQRNDNLGKELGFMGGNVTIMGVPLVWVDALDGGRGLSGASSQPAYDSTSPIYGIDWSQFKWVFLKGKNAIRTGPEKVSGAHNQRIVFVDNTGQFKYKRRDRGFVGYGV
jgi:hypothetical protein